MAHSLKSGSQSHIQSLQSLRGLAAFMVLLRHYFICFPLNGQFSEQVISVLLNSHAAVVVFFVLSGFVLFPSLQKISLTAKSVVGFYIRRAFRIFPLLIVVTLLSYGYVKSNFSAPHLTIANSWMSGLLPHTSSVGTISLIKCLTGMQSTLVPQNWTIMVEILIALVLPFVVKICSRNWVLNGFVFAGFATLSFVCANWGGKSLPFIYAVSFVIGMTAYRLLDIGMFRVSPVLLLLCIIGLLSTSTALSFATGVSTPFHDPLCSLIEGLFAGCVILGLATPNAISKHFTWTPLVWLGDVSFGVYLVHFLVIVVMARLMESILAPLSETTRSLTLLLPVVVVSLALAQIFYSAVEKPFIQLGRQSQRAFLKIRSA